jgi:hypothetical protein
MRVAQDQLFWARILYLDIDNYPAGIIFNAKKNVSLCQMIRVHLGYALILTAS